jgi:prevent-host-death family protein
MVPRRIVVLGTTARHTLGLMSETLPFPDALTRLSSLADRVEAGHERIVVTRNGRPSFILVSPDDLEALEEDLARALRRSHLTVADGTWARLGRRSVQGNEPT